MRLKCIMMHAGACKYVYIYRHLSLSLSLSFSMYVYVYGCVCVYAYRQSELGGQIGMGTSDMMDLHFLASGARLGL